MLKPSGNTPTRPFAQSNESGNWIRNWIGNRFSVGFVSLTCLGAVLSYGLADEISQRFTAQLGFRGDFRALLEFIGFLGHGIFCAFVVLTVLCLDWPKRRQAILIAVSALMAGGISSTIKHVVPRERPAIVAGREVSRSESTFSRSSYQSFPSGHSATAFALATSLALIYPHGRIFFFALATLVGVQRVLTQAHYPSDVFAGALIGFLVATLIGMMFYSFTAQATPSTSISAASATPVTPRKTDRSR